MFSFEIYILHVNNLKIIFWPKEIGNIKFFFWKRLTKFKYCAHDEVKNDEIVINVFFEK